MSDCRPLAPKHSLATELTLLHPQVYLNSLLKILKMQQL